MEKEIGLLFLLLQAIFDLKTRKISVLCAVSALVIGMIMNVGFCFENMWNCVWAGIPGLILMGISFLTENKAGMGDAMVVLSLSAFTQIRECLLICILAFFLTGLVGGILIVGEKRRVVSPYVKGEYEKKNKEVPFIPFLFLCAGLMYIGQKSGM